MNRDEATTTIRGILGEIAPEADLDSVDPKADLRTEIDLDSLDFLTLVERLAVTTGVDIPESDYRDVRSLSGLVEYLTARSG